jgi:squalene-hopene/tetraprenyl-beta-curcumene cyclase
MTPDLLHRVREAHQRVSSALLAGLGPDGYWTGELSSSALSTATAVIALATVDCEAHATLIEGGLSWLAAHANPDGGWGDTVRSRSNLSTTALVWAAFGAAQADARFKTADDGARAYLIRQAGTLEQLVPAIEACYGQDRTFSVPITMTLALSGRLGPDGWRRVRSLPFELAVLPRGLFGVLRLPVVSYALPALIAIGQVIHQRSGRWNPLRSLARGTTLDVLTTLQPDNGGFLEATPLTSFVTMSLAGMGLREHQVARRGVVFLRNAVRADGSWPIDTNLATWVTTLAIKALSHQPGALCSAQGDRLRNWLAGQQYREEHPYTGAAPGGWAWTDLPGGVPDADDTAGALLALKALGTGNSRLDPDLLQAASNGVAWLLNLQNRDGGIPTFCRGWGTLPFDRSTPELTAHALRAWNAWLPGLPSSLSQRVGRAAGRAMDFLKASQRDDGGWVPLWFGNEHAADHENAVYGTAQVLLGLPDAAAACALRERGEQFLVANQNPDGGWGGMKGTPSSVEETALAVDALAGRSGSHGAVEQGAMWLVRAIGDERLTPAPIGLYFARLWYFEQLYPLIFTTSALGRWLITH